MPAGVSTETGDDATLARFLHHKEDRLPEVQGLEGALWYGLN